MKYAFTGSLSGNININLKYQNSDQLLVSISDNGIGIQDDYDFDSTQSLGLQLVQLLSEQISAELTIRRRNPTSFTLIVPINEVN